MENIYLEKLKNSQEIIPEKYDGSYELVKETVKQYQYISLENVDFPDIDLIYFMTVGTWAYGIDKRKELIENSALDQPKKEYLNMLIDKIWDNAQKEMYIHKEFEGKTSIGMFGSGFRTFNGACDIDTVKRYISLMVNVNQMDNEDEILNYVENELQFEYKGIGIASFSQVLHCLKPHIFPIVNGNMGTGTTIYSKLEIEIDSKITPQNYIKNVRKIREFRNNNFSWKNYRIIDLLKVEENKMLENLNYEKLDEIIKNYKSEFNRFYLDELYKWEAIKTFQDNWDIDAENFPEMLNNSLNDAGNLLVAAYYFPKSMIVQFASKEPEIVREMFKHLFNEDIDLEERINNFTEKSKYILNKHWTEGRHDYQDTHVISTYLTFKYPEKYYIYKSSVDKKAASAMNVNIADSDNTVELKNYFALCDKILDYIKQDEELLNLSQNSLDDRCYKDSQYHGLVSDLLFFAGVRYRETKIWLYAPGENAVHWDECLKNNIMLLGFDELGDFNSYKYKSNIKNKFYELYSQNKSNDSLAAWEFKEEMQEGDIVYAKKGMSKIIGMGIVKSDYYYDDSRDYYKHVRAVEWQIYDIEKDYEYHKFAQKTLTDITKYPDFCENLEKLLDINLEINKLEKIEVGVNDKKYFWLNANPKIWSFSELKISEIIEYTAVNENGNKRRIYKNFQDAKKGDMVIAYEATPTKAVVGICVVQEELKDNILKIKKLENLVNPVPYSEILNEKLLENMEFLQNFQGSLFVLTENEYNIIMDMIRELNPISNSKNLDKYDKDKFLEQVYINDEEYDILTELLLKKRNLILQGPPGVGKTHMARKLAYSLIGHIDHEKIKFIQFHQSYSYEDFIEGYRPVENTYELEDGVFFNFCKKAKNDPENKYFFIIDEINRGNLSKIFGELLMLIESDKRGEKVSLAYSKKEFSVPENLYIIGMMNTADRSLALIDYALRRRFAFYKVDTVFENEKFKKYIDGLNNKKLNKVIEQIKALNSEIEEDLSLGEGFKIGHSYFCNLENVTDTDIKLIIEYEILPLIEEYWFDDKNTYKNWKDILNGVIDGKN